MLQRKVPVIYLLLFAIAGMGVTYGAYMFTGTDNAGNFHVTDSVVANNYCDHSIVRLNGYKYIKPFLHAEPECESNKYIGLKVSISDLIQNERSQGSILSASVFLSDLSQEDWIYV